jgi:flagellar operon protein
LTENNTLERLDKAVEAAQQKGANDALVLIDSTAFLVSVKNNKVITTVSADDLQGNVFTNIDSAVIG